MAAAREVTDATFAVDVLDSPKPVILDFWAQWCIPCRKIDKTIADLMTTDLAEKVVFAKVDIDSNPQTTQTYQVMSVPTIIVFKNGQPVASVTGVRPKNELIKMIETAIL